MDRSRSLDYLADSPEIKNTWRQFFRVVLIILQITMLCISISALAITIQVRDQHLPSLIKENPKTTSSLISSELNPLLSYLPGINREVQLNIPIQLDKIQQSATSEINRLTAAINQMAFGTLSPGLLLKNSKDYVGGINKPLIPSDKLNWTNATISGFIEHPSFIPGPTTKKGCTRIPSFHLAESHWCYTHNTIASGCEDHGVSSMYISGGILYKGSNKEPSLLTTVSILLADELNRKSCSIIASSYGCDVLCSLVTESESQDYKSVNPTPMVHGRLFFNGSYSEQELDPRIFGDLWTANYPGVGSGILLKDRLVFPIYGGLDETKLNLTSYLNHPLYTKNEWVSCNKSYDEVVQTLRAAYRPSWFAGRVVTQGVMVCHYDRELLGRCLIARFNTSTVMMGAESRLVMQGDSLLLYQRSSSWWPVGIVYLVPESIISINETNSVFDLSPIPLSKFPRPTNKKGYCERPAVCPAVCVTGVYQDLWPLSPLAIENRTATNPTFAGAFLNAFTTRTAPYFGVAGPNKWARSVQLFTDQTPASYSTTTCFKDTITTQTYCLIIIELQENLLGTWKIVPLLVKVSLVYS
ncbi:HN protein [avian paramyxovirus 11]|uniref:Hemagglutinin-neuraminidase n=1 Tax=avian paramyxovirus 11 TaxID=2560310 RepID=I6V5E6_9MONO|nr:HN protein [Avian paramyxovirus 11]AFN06858.1 HN protein [Avian paramyxovirus 11]